ncbi:MAG: diphthamide synthesis protein [Candidatus Nanoarchaeia archaeon]
MEETFSTYYNLELDVLVKQIEKNGNKMVVLQFPDGLKYYAKEVIDYLNKHAPQTIFFSYFGPCFGACDVPLHLKLLNFDLCVQWGHSVYIKKKGMW